MKEDEMVFFTQVLKTKLWLPLSKVLPIEYGHMQIEDTNEKLV